MGLALARALKSRGASVTLVAGPGVDKLPGCGFVPVISARDMLAAVKKRFARCDVFVSVAAVADYRPTSRVAKKLPKKKLGLRLALVPNPDILGEMGRLKKNQIVVGFALQDSLRDKGKAVRKMREKRCDIMVLNSVDAMDSDKISAALILSDRSARNLGTISKEACASKICQAIRNLRNF